jgi:OOP family OmpA-OmpF porin
MKQLNKVALALAATLVAGSVMAEGPQLYAVLGAGQSEYAETCDGVSSCDDQDTSWKIAGGAQFNDYLAVEFQYQEFGEADADAFGYEATAFGIHVLPQLPITEELSAFVRLGFVRAGVEGTGDLDGSDYETTTSYGLGVQYDITSNIAVRGEYDFIHNVGDGGDDAGDLPEDDITYLGVSAVYKF